MLVSQPWCTFTCQSRPQRHLTQSKRLTCGWRQLIEESTKDRRWDPFFCPFCCRRTQSEKNMEMGKSISVITEQEAQDKSRKQEIILSQWPVQEFNHIEKWISCLNDASYSGENVPDTRGSCVCTPGRKEKALVGSQWDSSSELNLQNGNPLSWRWTNRTAVQPCRSRG